MPNWNKSMKCRAWPSVSWKTIKKASQPASHWSWSTWWQLVEQVLHLHLHLQLQLQLGKSKTEKANLTSCFHAGQKDQDQDQDVARSACRKCGNVHFIAEIYSCAETRWWFMYVLALRALCAIGIKFLARIFHEVIMANGLLPCSSSCPSYFSIMLSVWLLIEKKKKKLTMANFATVTYQEKTADINGLSSNKCYNYLPAFISLFSRIFLRAVENALIIQVKCASCAFMLTFKTHWMDARPF